MEELAKVSEAAKKLLPDFYLNLLAKIEDHLNSLAFKPS
jgi:hypothetical protein